MCATAAGAASEWLQPAGSSCRRSADDAHTVQGGQGGYASGALSSAPQGGLQALQ